MTVRSAALVAEAGQLLGLRCFHPGLTVRPATVLRGRIVAHFVSRSYRSFPCRSQSVLLPLGPMPAAPPDLDRLFTATDDVARERAWALLVSAHSRLVLHVARSLGGDHDAVMDRYAYVLEELWRDDFHRLRTFARDGRSRFSTWLVVVARRLCLDHHRHRYGRPRAESEAARAATRALRRRLLDLVAEDIDSTPIPDDAATSPEARLRGAELEELLSAAVAELAPADRLLLRYRFDDDLPAREIAELMGFESPFHVYRRVNALCARLRQSLVEHGVHDPVP